MQYFRLALDDFFEIADDANLNFAADGAFTLLIVCKLPDVTPSSDMVLLAKKDDLTTAAGYALYVDTTGVPQLVIADGTNSAVASGPALTDDTQHVIAARRDVDNDETQVFVDGVGGTAAEDTTTATLANALPLRLGATSGTAANFFDGEIHATTLWREALTDAEIAQAGEELLLLLPDAPAHRRRRKYLLRTRGRAR